MDCPQLPVIFKETFSIYEHLRQMRTLTKNP